MIGTKFNVTTHNAAASAEFVYGGEVNIYIYIIVINVVFPILNVIKEIIHILLMVGVELLKPFLSVHHCHNEIFTLLLFDITIAVYYILKLNLDNLNQLGKKDILNYRKFDLQKIYIVRQGPRYFFELLKI